VSRPEAQLTCEVHGPMIHRDGEWVCRGFDGEWPEGHPGSTVPDEAAARVIAGQTWWPGVKVGVSNG
jgi:hypothetical protein